MPGPGSLDGNDRQVLFFSITPTCNCEDAAVKEICRFRALEPEAGGTAYDDKLQLHPPTLCHLGAQSGLDGAEDFYWGIFDRLRTRVYPGYKLGLFLTLETFPGIEERMSAFEKWLKDKKEEEEKAATKKRKRDDESHDESGGGGGGSAAAVST